MMGAVEGIAWGAFALGVLVGLGLAIAAAVLAVCIGAGMAERNAVSGEDDGDAVARLRDTVPKRLERAETRGYVRAVRSASARGLL